MNKFQTIDKLNYFDLLFLKGIVNITGDTEGYASTKEILRYMSINLKTMGLEKQSYSKVYYHKRIETLKQLGIIEVYVSGQRMARIKPNKRIAVVGFLNMYQLLIQGGNNE